MKVVIINVIMKLLQSHILSYSFPSVPSRITSSPDTQTVKEGSNVDVYCNATGKPAPNITWSRVLEDGINSKVLFVGSLWRIINLRRNFTGQYCCTAYNGIGSPVNHTFPVNVLCEYTLHFLLSLILLFGLINVSQLYLEFKIFMAHTDTFLFSIEVEILLIMVRLVYNLASTSQVCMNIAPG